MTKPFNKYDYYLRSVQTPDVEARFLEWLYHKENGRVHSPRHMQEDFCGTFALACEWVKLDGKRSAVGLDLDPEPLAYGRQRLMGKLTPNERKRIDILKQDVCSYRGTKKADIICALNFSYFIFKERTQLMRYFKHCRRGLARRGLLVLDAVGGPDYEEPHEDVTKKRGFTYFWQQKTFSPITRHATFAINFKIPGEKRRDDVFTYDWRLWTLPEIKDALLESGFSQVNIYWEGSTRSGQGNGEFEASLAGDDSSSWVAYISARA